MKLFEEWVYSMFASPMQLLKGSSQPRMRPGALNEHVIRTMDVTKARVAMERSHRGKALESFHTKMNAIPDIQHNRASVNNAVEQVQSMVGKARFLIRGAISDQIEVHSKSFFLAPMLRRLPADMTTLDIDNASREESKTQVLLAQKEARRILRVLKDLDWCIDRVQNFKFIASPDAFITSTMAAQVTASVQGRVSEERTSARRASLRSGASLTLGAAPTLQP